MDRRAHTGHGGVVFMTGLLLQAPSRSASGNLAAASELARVDLGAAAPQVIVGQADMLRALGFAVGSEVPMLRVGIVVVGLIMTTLRFLRGRPWKPLDARRGT